MLSTIVRKKTRVLALILTLVALVTATMAFGAPKKAEKPNEGEGTTSKLVPAKTGGKINVADGVIFVVKPKTLVEDTVVSAEMVVEEGYLCFIFGPSGTVFRKGLKEKPAKLIIECKVLRDLGVGDLTLHGADGEAQEYSIESDIVIYEIPHFSLYYFRRR